MHYIHVFALILIFVFFVYGKMKARARKFKFDGGWKRKFIAIKDILITDEYLLVTRNQNANHQIHVDMASQPESPLMTTTEYVFKVEGVLTTCDIAVIQANKIIKGETV